MRTLIALIMTIAVLSGCKQESKAPVNVNLNDMNGKTIESVLGEYSFELAVVNYFATFCSPCKKEMPELQKLYTAYKDRNIAILSFTTESESMKPTVEGMLKMLGISYPAYYNAPQSVFGETISVLPVTYVVDKNGTVIKKLTGLFQPEVLEELILEYAAETPRVTSANLTGFGAIQSDAVTYYTVDFEKKSDEATLVFRSKAPYQLGGEEYPPLEITVFKYDGVTDKTFTLPYSKDGYSIALPVISGEITGHIKANACTDTGCYFVNEDFSVSSK